MRTQRSRQSNLHRQRPMLEHQACAVVTARSRFSVASTSASYDGIAESYHDPDERNTELVLMMWNDAEGGTPEDIEVDWGRCDHLRDHMITPIHMSDGTQSTPREEDNIGPHDVEYYGLCAEISHSNTSAAQWCIDCHCAAKWVVPWALCSWYCEPYELPNYICNAFMLSPCTTTTSCVLPQLIPI